MTSCSHSSITNRRASRKVVIQIGWGANRYYLGFVQLDGIEY